MSTFAPREPVERDGEQPAESASRVADRKSYPEFDEDEVNKIEWGFQAVEKYFPDINIDDKFNVKQTPATFIDTEYQPWKDDNTENFLGCSNVVWRRGTHVRETKYTMDKDAPEDEEKDTEIKFGDKTTQEQYDEYITPRADYYSACAMVFKTTSVEAAATARLLKQPMPDQNPEGSNYMRVPACLHITPNKPLWSQKMCAVLASLEESGKNMPPGSFLWELIYPQADVEFMAEDPPEPPPAVEGEEPPEVPEPPPPLRIKLPVVNPSGRYVVKLFIQGKWRRIIVDDILPVNLPDATDGGPAASIFPTATTNSIVTKLSATAPPATSRKKKGNRPNAKKDIEKHESLWSHILCKAILKVSTDLTKIPLFHLLTGFLPVVSPLSWDTLWTRYMTTDFLHVWLPLDMAQDGDDAGSDIEGLDSRCVLPWTICEMNQAIDEHGQIVHRQIRLKLCDSKPVAAMESKLLQIVDNSDEDDSTEEDDDSEQARQAKLERRRQREERKRRMEEGDSVYRQHNIDDGVWMDYEDFQDFTEKIYYCNPSTNYSLQDYDSWPNAENVKPTRPMIVRIRYKGQAPPVVPDSPHSEPSIDLHDAYLLESQDLEREEPDEGSASTENQKTASSAALIASPSQDVIAEVLTDLILSIEPGAPSQMDGCYLYNCNSWKFKAHRGGCSLTAKTANATKPTGYVKPPSSQALEDFPRGAPPNEIQDIDLRSERMVYVDTNHAQRMQCVIPVHVTQAGCEQWLYMVEPYNNVGGARFTAFVEKNNANLKGKVDFIDPVTMLEEKVGLPVLKVANEVETPADETAAAELAVYPKGYSVLSKLQFKSKLSASKRRRLTAFSYIANPEIAKFMRISIYTRTNATIASPTDEENPSAVYTTQCFSGPFLPFFAFELPKGETEFILLLECQLPEAVRDTEYFLHMFEQLVDSYALSDKPKEGDKPAPYEVTGIGFAQKFFFRSPVTPLKSFDPLILRERIYVKPEEQDRVNLTLRVAVNFPDCFFTAKLVLQKPPPLAEDAEPPSPEEAMQPAAFGDRYTWLESLQTICEQSGKDSVLFPHLELFPNAVYILVVEFDSSRCKSRTSLPVNSTEEEVEPEHFWEMEIFADGNVVVGNETMEHDLEALVIESWAQQAETSTEERKEAASLSRTKWIEEGKEGEINATFVTNMTKPEGEEVSDKELIKQRYKHGLTRKGHVNVHVLQFLYDILERPIATEFSKEPAVTDPSFDWNYYQAQSSATLKKNAKLIPRAMKWYQDMRYGNFMFENERTELIEELVAAKEALEKERAEQEAAEAEAAAAAGK